MSEYITVQQRLLKFAQTLSQSPVSREVIRKIWTKTEDQMHRLRPDLENESSDWQQSDHPEGDAVEVSIDISVLLYYGDNLTAAEIASLAAEPVPA